MKILGVDFGNYNTKTSEGIIFQSKISKDEGLMNHRKATDENLMKIDGKRMLVGEGEFETEVNKLDKDMFKACVLKALALSTDEDILKIIIGLPSNQFNSKNKEKLKNDLLSDKIYSFELGGKEKTLIIEDLDFFPECAGAYHALTKEQRTQIQGRDLVLVNLGGGNTNIGYFKLDGKGRKMVKSSTNMSGVLHLYADVINAINGEFSLNKSIEDAERILSKSELLVYGEKQDLTFLREIIEIHLDRIFKELNLYPIRDSAVMFTGGAIKLYKKILMKRVPNCLFQTNYLLGNAQGFKKAGEYKWQNEFL
ncbi:hypothetical protein DP68_09035 [Clostridium sp. HMP27]|nr:hypothetical protein DP68_09035 [Clostridium sp. HMP27]